MPVKGSGVSFNFHPFKSSLYNFGHYRYFVIVFVRTVIKLDLLIFQRDCSSWFWSASKLFPSASNLFWDIFQNPVTSTPLVWDTKQQSFLGFPLPFPSSLIRSIRAWKNHWHWEALPHLPRPGFHHHQYHHIHPYHNKHNQHQNLNQILGRHQ